MVLSLRLRKVEEMPTNLSVDDTPKMIRETLCVVQSRIADSPLDEDRKWEHIERLQRLIDECDRQRRE